MIIEEAQQLDEIQNLAPAVAFSGRDPTRPTPVAVGKSVDDHYDDDEDEELSKDGSDDVGE